MRLRSLQAEFGSRLQIDWKAFLLRPQPSKRSLASFVSYTERWLRVGAEPDSGDFRVWQSDEGPPSHSVPPYVVAKAAARIGAEAFETMHDRLLRAYFWDHRDITARPVLAALWTEVGLPADRFPGAAEELLAEIAAEHEEAMNLSVGGVPAIRRADQSVALVGAQPVEAYRHWIRRILAAEV